MSNLEIHPIDDAVEVDVNPEALALVPVCQDITNVELLSNPPDSPRPLRPQSRVKRHKDDSNKTDDSSDEYQSATDEENEEQELKRKNRPIASNEVATDSSIDPIELPYLAVIRRSNLEIQKHEQELNSLNKPTRSGRISEPTERIKERITELQITIDTHKEQKSLAEKFINEHRLKIATLENTNRNLEAAHLAANSQLQATNEAISSLIADRHNIISQANTIIGQTEAAAVEQIKYIELNKDQAVAELHRLQEEITQLNNLSPTFIIE